MRASIAVTVAGLPLPVVYITPSTTIGVASSTELPPRIGKLHAVFSWRALFGVICVSAE